MTTAALIVAAGRGTRAGSSQPKQWHLIAGESVLSHTLMAFTEHPMIDQIILVLHADDLNKAPSLQNLTVVVGGADRAASVRSGLTQLHENIEKVLIHDVARPCVSAETISSVIDALNANAGAAPALAVTDALWTGADGNVTGTQDRSGLYRAQTPQGFDRKAIVAAHAAHAGGAADDVEVARAAGISVAIVAGDEDNLKITLPADFARAERILERRDGR